MRLLAAKNELIVLAAKLSGAVSFGMSHDDGLAHDGAIGVRFLCRLDDAFTAVHAAFGGARNQVILADRRYFGARYASGQNQRKEEGGSFHKSPFFVKRQVYTP